MKKLQNILLFAAVVCASAFVSCAKEENTIDNTPKYTPVELTFTRANSTQEQGDKITDVTVWAYEINGSGTNLTVGNDGKPVGWGTRTFNVYESTSPQTLYMELPYSADEKKYRFFAVVNRDEFGKIYTPMRNGQQSEITTLSSEATYNDLSTYVFENNTLLQNAPTTATPELMPVSHWEDVTIPANTAKGSTINVNMTVYRALGKVSLNASLDAASSTGAQLKITEVTIGAKTVNMTVAQQGFMFSDVKDVSNLDYPSHFGTIADIKRGQSAETSNLTTETVVESASKIICSKFLYENHHADVAQGVIANADAAGDGQYYMKIAYTYGTNYDKSGVGYVALPAIVRNHETKVNASFKVNTQGVLTLNCTVADWLQDDEQGETELEFNYPTYSVMAFDRGADNAEVYNEPIVTYDATNPTSFTMLFQMSAPTDGSIKWKPIVKTKSGTEISFSVQVFNVNNVETKPEITGENLYTTSNTEFTASSNWYAVRVTPLASATDEDKITELRIVYNAPWLGKGVYESMLINGTSGSSKWPNSGNDPHYIEITQKGTSSN